jgi:hypothetical protein
MPPAFATAMDKFVGLAPAMGARSIGTLMSYVVQKEVARSNGSKLVVAMISIYLSISVGALKRETRLIEVLSKQRLYLIDAWNEVGSEKRGTAAVLADGAVTSIRLGSAVGLLDFLFGRIGK